MPPVEEWITGPGGRSFYTKRWVPTGNVKAQILLLHGFGEHVTRYDHVLDRLSIRGFASFAYDQRGSGKTAQKDNSQGITSWKQAFEDISFFIKRTAEGTAKDKPLFLFGHSMGGALSIAYATRQPAQPGVALLSGVIASAPLIDQAPGVKASPLLVKAGSMIGMILPSLQLNVGVPSGDISRDPKVNEVYAADPLCAPIGSYKGVADMLLGGPKLIEEAKRWPPELPVFVYHGTADKVVSFEKSKACFDNIAAKDKTFKEWPNAYHEPHNEIGDLKWAVIDEVEAWLNAHIKSETS